MFPMTLETNVVSSSAGCPRGDLIFPAFWHETERGRGVEVGRVVRETCKP